MTSKQFLAIWNLKLLNEQAYQRYKDFGYLRRERVLPSITSINGRLVMDEQIWQNLLNKNNWYEIWQSKVEHGIARFKNKSVNSLLKFHDPNLGEWSDTVANRLEKQMLYLNRLILRIQKEHGFYHLHKTHFDISSKCLYVLRLKDQGSWKVKVVDFSKTKYPAIILEEIYKEPLEHHFFYNLESTINPAGNPIEERTVYYTIGNINKKVNTEMQQDFGLLSTSKEEVWIDQLHI